MGAWPPALPPGPATAGHTGPHGAISGSWANRGPSAAPRPPKAPAPAQVTTTEVTPAAPVKDLGDLSRWAVTDRLKYIIEKGAGTEAKEGDNSKSAWLFDVVCNLIRHGVPDTVIHTLITDSKWRISESVHAASNPEAYARKQLADGHKFVEKSPVLLYKADPMHNARQFVRARAPRDAGRGASAIGL